MPLRLFDNHESVLHVTLGQGESALDAYKALRRNAGKTAPAKHIAIVDSTLPFSSGAIDVPCMKPTAAHCVAASPVDERPCSPTATPSTPPLHLPEAEPSAEQVHGRGSLSPAALTFSSEDETVEDGPVEPLQLGTTHSGQLRSGEHGVATPEDHAPPTEPTVASPTRVLTLIDLPPELLVAIFGWLQGDVIAQICSAVCKTWWQVAKQSDELWRIVCVRRFPWHAYRGHNQSWCQLFKDEWLWMHSTAEGSLSSCATSDQRSRYSTEVIGATERPMALNS